MEGEGSINAAFTWSLGIFGYGINILLPHVLILEGDFVDLSWRQRSVQLLLSLSFEHWF